MRLEWFKNRKERKRKEKRRNKKAWRIEGATTLTAPGSAIYTTSKNGYSAKNLTKTHN
jgi:hypothetical protein